MLAVLLLIAVAAVGGWLFTDARSPDSAGMASSVVEKLEDLAVAVGLGIDQVSVTGHGHTLADEIFEGLALGDARTVFGLDVDAAQTRIERLSWVKTATISRVFPGQLAVRITERLPHALWHNDGALHLVDKAGRVLGRTNDRAAPDLPVIMGDGAPEQSAEILNMVARAPKLWERFVSAERVSGRRWRINLKNGSRIELPASDDGHLLAADEVRSVVDRMVGRPNLVIDLRARGRIAIHRAESRKAHHDVPRTIQDVLARGG